MSASSFPTLSPNKILNECNQCQRKFLHGHARTWHGLLIMPNEMYLNPSLSPLVTSNLFGLNLLGSSHSLGFLCMNYAFTNKIVPHCDWNSPTMQSSKGKCGNKNGCGGFSTLSLIRSLCNYKNIGNYIVLVLLISLISSGKYNQSWERKLVMEGHGVQTTSKALVFAMRNSEPEVMSTIFFPTISQSKHWMNAPIAKDITRMPSSLCQMEWTWTLLFLHWFLQISLAWT